MHIIFFYLVCKQQVSSVGTSMSNDSFESLWTLGTIEHQQSFNAMVRKSSFWESAKIFKDELKYLGYHKTFIFKTGNKNVLWFQYRELLLEITKS